MDAVPEFVSVQVSADQQRKGWPANWFGSAGVAPSPSTGLSDATHPEYFARHNN
jgi:hypothetical protein